MRGFPSCGQYIFAPQVYAVHPLKSDQLPHRVSYLQPPLIGCFPRSWTEGTRGTRNTDDCPAAFNNFEVCNKVVAHPLGESMTSSVLHWKFETLTYRIYCLIQWRRQHTTNRENRLLHASIYCQYRFLDSRLWNGSALRATIAVLDQCLF
jgi:hypothetical protein